MIGPDDHWFTDRPTRTECCGRCRGTGTVTRAYALAPADRVVGAPCDAIRAFVIGSFDIATACEEASDIAKRSGEQVAFQFNGQCVVVGPGDSVSAVISRWWRRAYGMEPTRGSR